MQDSWYTIFTSHRGLLGCLMTLALAGCTQAQFLSTQGSAIINENGDTVTLRGMGLGGWMLQEGYMLQTSDFADAQHEIREHIEALIGAQRTQEFYDAWLANHVRQADIDALHAWGFNSVRLPMHYNLYTLPVEEEPVAGEHTWLETGFALTDSLISWCAQNAMYVILDLHAAPGGQGYESSISDYDPDKPSLWESPANRAKTVALWRKLAERYANEPWVGGYDLINEPNWNLPGNTALRTLYEDITAAIRTVDQQHIIFIEGNWFANDFTGLTPPWDDNMAYSPHKYWSFNDQGSIQWVLSLRDAYDVPIYFGEWGENSNTWFRDAVRLFEDSGLGWACWPMKKIESVAGPLSIVKSSGYQDLLDYWSGQGAAPSGDAAFDILMQLTEDIRLERCTYQKDVIDAMFTQVASDDARPFADQSIPGVVFATDFDLGPHGVAYSDHDIATYHVSAGDYTAWNQGWSYRNDGADIEPCVDDVNSNGFNLGWLEEGEWTQYTVAVESDAVYQMRLRAASEQGGGALRLAVEGADLTGRIEVPATGGWQDWESIWIDDVVLSPADQLLRLLVERPGFNLSSFELIYREPSHNVPTTYISAQTQTESAVALNINKRLVSPLAAEITDFEIAVNGAPVVISGLQLDDGNERQIILSAGHVFRAGDNITVSYQGNGILAQDSTALEAFSELAVENTIATVHTLPGRIEAEDYFFQSGAVLEQTTDAGGGQNIGHLDVGDYLDYRIVVPESRSYRVDYRTAALSEEGRIILQLVSENGSTTNLHAVSFPATGGWQTWTTTSKTVGLLAGEHHLRVLVDAPLFNLNWMEFSFVTATENPSDEPKLNILPNPASDQVRLTGSVLDNGPMRVVIHDVRGRRMLDRKLGMGSQTLDMGFLADGVYYITLMHDTGNRITRPFIKTQGR